MTPDLELAGPAEAEADAGDDAGDDADASMRSQVGDHGAPLLRLDVWEGPLDLLLELARAQRVDLTRLSITDLAGQFAAAVEAATAERALPLHRLGGWLVMAAWLLLLRARLLLPEDSDAGQEARREAQALRRQLADREFIRRLATWLQRRPQLGREVFGRGRPEEPETATPAVDVAGLLRACLAVLQRPGQEGPYRPAPMPLWRLPQAMARLRRMLPALKDGVPLEHFLPPASDEQPNRTLLQQRAALASTLMAGLELEREGSASLDQAEAFGQIRVVPLGRPAA